MIICPHLTLGGRYRIYLRFSVYFASGTLRLFRYRTFAHFSGSVDVGRFTFPPFVIRVLPVFLLPNTDRASV